MSRFRLSLRRHPVVDEPSTPDAVADELRQRDEHFMRVALTKAYAAALGDLPDLPFGCVIVDPEGLIVAAMHSREVATCCPTRHAELECIEAACESLLETRRVEGGQVAMRGGVPLLLRGYTLYSTHELCAMCANAALHAGISRIVYGSSRADLPERFAQKQNALEWVVANSSQQPQVTGGVMRDACIALLVAHFPTREERARGHINL